MKVELDNFEMYCLLESCIRGSHLRSSTILRFVDDWYELFTKEQREKLYYICYGIFGRYVRKTQNRRLNFINFPDL